MASRIINKAALARELGLTRGRISQYITSGMPTLAGGGVDRAVALAWTAENVVRPDSVSEGYQAARRLDAIFRAKLMRLRYERRAGKLVERDAVRRRLDQHLAMLRAGLEALAERLAARLEGESDRRKVHALMKAEIAAELNRLADLIGGSDQPSLHPPA